MHPGTPQESDRVCHACMLIEYGLKSVQLQSKKCHVVCQYLTACGQAPSWLRAATIFTEDDHVTAVIFA